MKQDMHDDETVVRRKHVEQISKNPMNPITEGSNKIYKANTKKHGNKNETLALNTSIEDIVFRPNNKSVLEQTMRMSSPTRGKVFKEHGMNPNCTLKEDAKVEVKKGIRCGSAKSLERGRGSMKTLMEYNFSLPFRPDNLSPKCNALSPKSVAQWSVNYTGGLIG